MGSGSRVLEWGVEVGCWNGEWKYGIGVGSGSRVLEWGVEVGCRSGVLK